MILPTKHLSAEKSLLGVGALALRCLDEPGTVSRLWEVTAQAVEQDRALGTLTFDWFVLALDMLFAIGAVEMRDGLLRRIEQ